MFSQTAKRIVRPATRCVGATTIPRERVRSFFVPAFFPVGVGGGGGGGPLFDFDSKKDKLLKAVRQYDFETVRIALPVDQTMLSKLQVENNLFNSEFYNSHETKVTENLEKAVFLGVSFFAFGGSSAIFSSIFIDSVQPPFSFILAPLSAIFVCLTAPIAVSSGYASLKGLKTWAKFRNMTPEQNKVLYQKMARLLENNKSS
jgi:hypothetical protein